MGQEKSWQDKPKKVVGAIIPPTVGIGNSPASRIHRPLPRAKKSNMRQKRRYLKLYFSKVSGRIFSDILIEEVKVMSDKVLKLSRRYVQGNHLGMYLKQTPGSNMY